MHTILEHIGLLGILPVAIVEDEHKAPLLAQTLLANGLPVIEVTFRTQAAVRVIERIAADASHITVGAGTVLTIDQVKAAADAGASFIVSPGLNPKIVEYCLARNIPVVPGVATPTEIQHALEYNLEAVKFFPAEACGGLTYLRAIAAPFKNLKFIPTGGIDQSNLLPYLQCPEVLACGGSWMVKPELLKEDRFEEIGVMTRQAIAGMLGFELRHIGMNSASPEDAAEAAKQLEQTFYLEPRETPGSIFVGTGFEVLKRQYLGTHGHIAIATNFIERAVAHLALKGVRIKEETRDTRNGRLAAVYLEMEIGGYAVHLLQV
jgi:2-dehydro-3-deoxyphosphogluconate aldolase/(4S)-4-hydroxy-2-oxoglutarate aldolase